IGIGAMAREDWGDDENQDEGGQENADGRNQRAPEARYQIADEGSGDDDWAGAYDADRDRDEELPAAKPAGLLHQPFFEEWHDNEAAAEGEASSLQEKNEELSQR